MLRAPLWALCCCLLAVDLVGCETGCDKESAEPLAYLNGQTSPSCTSYQTNGFDERYVNFPPGRRLRLMHGLGQTPNSVVSYVAFTADALPQAEIGNTAESAGNQVIIEAVNDEYVQVRNDTCEYFFLRVVLEVDAPAPDCLAATAAGGAGGAGG
jgi:hypothetical protein